MASYMGKMLDVMHEELERLERELKTVIEVAPRREVKDLACTVIEGKATMLNILALAFPEDGGFRLLAEDANMVAMAAIAHRWSAGES